jgi:hypothetical protein
LLQNSSIATALTQKCSNLSQEATPEIIAAEAANAIQKYLTEENRAAFAKFRSTDSPYLLLKAALDVQNLPPTPSDDRPPAESLWRQQAAALLGYLKLCDLNALSFSDEMGGRLFHMVMPAQNDHKSRLRSTKALNFHTEVVNGYFREEQPRLGLPIAPEKFALGCLRNPNGVPTTLLPLSAVIENLSAESLGALQKSEYVATSQSSFDKDFINDSVPVLVPLSSGHLGIRYSHSKLMAKTPTSAKALSELRAIIESFDSSSSITLEPGDVLILNNRCCLHGRGEVASSSQFLGADRWLIRLYGYAPETLPYIARARIPQHVMLIE